MLWLFLFYYLKQEITEAKDSITWLAMGICYGVIIDMPGTKNINTGINQIGAL